MSTGALGLHKLRIRLKASVMFWLHEHLMLPMLERRLGPEGAFGDGKSDEQILREARMTVADFRQEARELRMGS